MGTSSSGSGPRPTTPLIPSWIPETLPELEPPQQEEDNKKDEESNESTNTELDQTDNRFKKARQDFRKFAKSKGSSSTHLYSAIRNYIKTSSGGSGSLSRRMRPATSRISILYNVLTTFQEKGKKETLKSFDLSEYKDKSLIEVLSALMDEVFKRTNNLFDGTQDDNITKQAYANTITRIVEETSDIDLDKLSNDNIDTMISVFIEETIATRVITDIGTSIVEELSDPKEILDLENSIYQIVSGLVRNKIMNQLKSVRQGGIADLENRIENIYRITFDTILGLD